MKRRPLLVIIDPIQFMGTKQWDVRGLHVHWKLVQGIERLWQWVREEKILLMFWTNTWKVTLNLFLAQCVPRDVQAKLFATWWCEQANQCHASRYALPMIVQKANVVKNLDTVWRMYPLHDVDDTLIIDRPSLCNQPHTYRYPGNSWILPPHTKTSSLNDEFDSILWWLDRLMTFQQPVHQFDSPFTPTQSGITVEEKTASQV